MQARGSFYFRNVGEHFSVGRQPFGKTESALLEQLSRFLMQLDPFSDAGYGLKHIVYLERPSQGSNGCVTELVLVVVGGLAHAEAGDACRAGDPKQMHCHGVDLGFLSKVTFRPP